MYLLLLVVVAVGLPAIVKSETVFKTLYLGQSESVIIPNDVHCNMTLYTTKDGNKWVQSDSGNIFVNLHINSSIEIRILNATISNSNTYKLFCRRNNFTGDIYPNAFDFVQSIKFILNVVPMTCETNYQYSDDTNIYVMELDCVSFVGKFEWYRDGNDDKLTFRPELINYLIYINKGTGLRTHKLRVKLPPNVRERTDSYYCKMHYNDDTYVSPTNLTVDVKFTVLKLKTIDRLTIRCPKDDKLFIYNKLSENKSEWYCESQLAQTFYDGFKKKRNGTIFKCGSHWFNQLLLVNVVKKKEFNSNKTHIFIENGQITNIKQFWLCKDAQAKLAIIISVLTAFLICHFTGSFKPIRV